MLTGRVLMGVILHKRCYGIVKGVSELSLFLGILASVRWELETSLVWLGVSMVWCDMLCLRSIEMTFTYGDIEANIEWGFKITFMSRGIRATFSFGPLSDGL